MKHMRWMFYISMALMVLLAACAPASTPTPPADTANSAPAADTATSAPPTAASTTAPLDLAGPPMQVGSTYLYFDGALLVAVPGGSFTMGHGGADNPEHTVTLSDFWIYSTKVTNREYEQCEAVGKCTAPDLQDNQGYNDPDHQSDPVTGVNWTQGEAYCEYANGQLPTEAQWEKTARGPDGNIYPWGNNAPADDLLNFNNAVGHTTNVINYPKGKSFYDALDMEGNAQEWVYDWYDYNYYKTSPAQDPLGPDLSPVGNRSVRAGGYKSNTDQVPASTRFYKLPTDHARDLGFRCVVKDPTFFAPACQLTSYVGVNLSGVPGSSSPACGKPTITTTGPDCSQLFGVVTVDAGSGDNNLQASGSGGCNPTNNLGGHAAKFTCPTAGSVTVTYTCGSGPISQTCPAHYNFQGGQCVWDQSGTAGQACPAGEQYDQTQMCCSSTPGSATNFSACPPGSNAQDLGGGQFACVQDGAEGSQQSVSVSVGAPPSPNQCSSGGGSCNLSPSSCKYPFCHFDEKTCSCTRDSSCG